MASSLFREPTLPESAPPAATEPDPDELAPTAEAPYGYLREPDGTLRPKKTAGRQRRGAPPKPALGVPPSIEDLKAAKEAGPKPGKPKEDVPPAEPKRSGARLKLPSAPEPKGPFRAGPIAKGVNRIYRKAGRIIRIWDPAVGQAFIESATKEDDDDTTVGEAWEELARVNPKIRAFLERIITGGAWGSLVAAHMPIVLAILLKDGIRDRLPLGHLLGAVMDSDEPQAPGPGGTDLGGLASVFEGMSAQDLAGLGQMAMGMMPGMMAGMPRDPGAAVRHPGPVVDQEGRDVA